MGNPAESLQQVRTQQKRTPAPAPLRSSPRNREEFDAMVDNGEVKRPSEHLADMRSLFTEKHTRNTIKMVYNSLSPRQRGMVCIAGGLSPHDYTKNFEDFHDLELQSIRRGLQELSGINRRFESVVGNVKRLKPSAFY